MGKTKNEWHILTSVSMDQKTGFCSRCQEVVSILKRVRDNGKVRYTCKNTIDKEKMAQNRKNFRAKRKALGIKSYRQTPQTPEYRKNSSLKRKFGITLDQYFEILEKQNNVCDICKKYDAIIDHRTNKPRSMPIDHDHETGESRGILCSKCNFALGGFGDSIEILHNAIEYLRKYGK